MKRKDYIFPIVEILPCEIQNLMKVASDEPIDPGATPAPESKPKAF